ncbi:MAG TPA: DNA primase [Acidimicrobiales bacterium]|nr:DNA primase [Acidimicrobiales bacterium]
MAIAEEDVARVVAATDLVALIGEHLALKRQGVRFVGLCPFHQEKTPSFSVSLDKGLYYCFGCQRSGDAISFLREIEHIDFVEAVQRLAERAGITIAADAAESVERKRRAPLYEALERAVEFYHQRLLGSPDAGRARDYLRSRGYDGEVVRSFRLGWAPDDWDALSKHLKVPDRVLEDAGLGFVNRRGRQQDSFRARVVFPIFDPSGRPVALGGRILPPAPGAPTGADAGPKYKNSPEGPVYAKRRTLYGLNWAKKDIVARGEVIVCEGYTDVIAFFQAGLPCAVATCGTALGEEHFRLLRNFAKRIVLAYDADAAGQAGASRVYEWERRHEVDLAVAALPPGADPADLVRRDPGQLRAAVADARPFLRFRVERVLDGADLASAEGRAKAAEAAMRSIAEHPNDLVRDQYLMFVADRCRLDAATLRPMLERFVRQGAPAPPSAGRRTGTGAGEHAGDESPGRAGGPVDDGERAGAGRPGPTVRAGGEASRSGLEALRLAVHRPGTVADRLEPVLFDDPVQRAAFCALVDHDDLYEAVEEAERHDPEVSRLLRRVTVEEPAGDADDVFVILVRNATRRALSDIEAQARIDPAGLRELAPVAATVRHDLEELDEPTRAVAAADRLLAWLVGRGEESR